MSMMCYSEFNSSNVHKDTFQNFQILSKLPLVSCRSIGYVMKLISSQDGSTHYWCYHKTTVFHVFFTDVKKQVG